MRGFGFGFWGKRKRQGGNNTSLPTPSLSFSSNSNSILIQWIWTGGSKHIEIYSRPTGSGEESWVLIVDGQTESESDYLLSSLNSNSEYDFSIRISEDGVEWGAFVYDSEYTLPATLSPSITASDGDADLSFLEPDVYSTDENCNLEYQVGSTNNDDWGFTSTINAGNAWGEGIVTSASPPSGQFVVTVRARLHSATSGKRSAWTVNSGPVYSFVVRMLENNTVRLLEDDSIRFQEN